MNKIRGDRKAAAARQELGGGGGGTAETGSKVRRELADDFRAKDKKLCKCSTGMQKPAQLQGFGRTHHSRGNKLMDPRKTGKERDYRHYRPETAAKAG